MKKGKKIVVILVVAISIISYYHSNKYKNTDLLLLDNIEAMASGENTNYMCYGTGVLDCGGEKVYSKQYLR